jgi:hypothetical protein
MSDDGGNYWEELRYDVRDAGERAQRGGDDIGTILVRVHGGKARNRKVVVVAVFDARGGRGVVKVIWVVAVPVIVRVVLEPADVVGVVAVFNAGGGRGVVEGIWVVAVPVVVWNVLEPADVVGVLAVSVVVPWHEG